jgi:hypothetical protein
VGENVYEGMGNKVGMGSEVAGRRRGLVGKAWFEKHELGGQKIQPEQWGKTTWEEDVEIFWVVEIDKE